MLKEFEVRWEGELPATPQEVWDAFTRHTAGWLWKIDYEPWVGGSEEGLSNGDGRVTVWDPPRHFTTRVDLDDGGFNQLDYVLEPRGTGTYLRFRHNSTVPVEGYDDDVDACRLHTDLYNHSLGEYLRHFAGRDAAYLRVDGPEASADGGFAAMLHAMGVPDDVAAGDEVVLTPTGIAPIEGVVDYRTDRFLGVRSADALYRFYGRDAWGWPAGLAHHLFADGADEASNERAWTTWMNDLFATKAVA